MAPVWREDQQIQGEITVPVACNLHADAPEAHCTDKQWSQLHLEPDQLQDMLRSLCS